MELGAAPAWRRGILAVATIGVMLAAVAVQVPVAGAGESFDLVFMRLEGTESDIYTVDVDGSNLTRVGPGADPALSPDGRRIAFSDHEGGRNDHDIYVMNVDGSGRRRFTTSPEDDVTPVWSPDGRRIAFIRRDVGCCAVGESHLWLMNADGSDPTRAPTGSDGLRDSWPSWSPDGRSIAFGRSGDEGRWISVLDLGTGRTTRLTDSGRDYLPAWSTDNRITFASIRHTARPGVGSPAHAELYRISDRGTDLTRLTHTDEDEFAASWSPDGAVVAFVRDPDGGTGVGMMCDFPDPACEDEESTGELPGAIHVMSADGSEERALTSPPDGASDSSPRFRPAPVRAQADAGERTPVQPQEGAEPPGRAQVEKQAQVDGDRPARGPSPGRSEDWVVADRAPTVEGVGITGDPDSVAGQADDGAPVDGWAAALVAGLILGGLGLMGFAGRRRQIRPRT